MVGILRCLEYFSVNQDDKDFLRVCFFLCVSMVCFRWLFFLPCVFFFFSFFLIKKIEFINAKSLANSAKMTNNQSHDARLHSRNLANQIFEITEKNIDLLFQLLVLLDCDYPNREFPWMDLYERLCDLYDNMREHLIPSDDMLEHLIPTVADIEPIHDFIHDTICYIKAFIGPFEIDDNELLYLIYSLKYQLVRLRSAYPWLALC
jgi:hypothetical protein